MTFDLPQRKSFWEPQDLGMRSLEDTKTTLTFCISEEQLLILAEANGNSQYYCTLFETTRRSDFLFHLPDDFPRKVGFSGAMFHFLTFGSPNIFFSTCQSQVRFCMCIYIYIQAYVKIRYTIVVHSRTICSIYSDTMKFVV
jgi:hypothetical protein